MRNLEAKFHLADHAAARARAETIGFSASATLAQRDTFFAVRHGKLKLRQEGDRAWLIHYVREREAGLDLSNYEIAEVARPEAIRAMLAGALGIIAEVRKRRTLLMRRNVRLHLDRVDGLGDFGEIEAVLADGDDREAISGEVGEILTALNVGARDLIGKSYFEMISPK
jgi:predicted adenylyl cyclase CyaB